MTSHMEIPSFFKAWFAFVALLTLSMMAGSAYVVFLLLNHFGVM